MQYSELCNEVVKMWNADASTEEIINSIDGVTNKSQVSTIVVHSRVCWSDSAKARHKRSLDITTVLAYFLRQLGLSYAEITSLLQKHGMTRSNGAYRTAITSRKNRAVSYKNCEMLYDGEIHFEGDIHELLREEGHDALSLDIQRLQSLREVLGGNETSSPTNVYREVSRSE